MSTITWRTSKLGEVCERHCGSRDPREQPEAEFLYVDISSVDSIRKVIVEPKRLLGKEAPSRARKIIRQGDVIVSTTRPNLNAVAVVPADLHGAMCSTGFCVLRAKSDEIDKDFLFAYVRSDEFVLRLSALVKGALYPAVTDSEVFDQLVPVPPLMEQRRIATVLNVQIAQHEVTRKIVAERGKLAAALATAYLRAVFPANLGNGTLVPSGWRKVALGEASNITSGVTVGRKLSEVPTRRVPYLRVANVKDGYLDLSEIKEIEVTDTEFTKWRLKRGDILLTEGGDLDKLGRGTYWSDQIPDCVHQNHIFRVRFDPEVAFSPFVSAQLGSPYGKAYFLRHAKQTTGIASINQRVLRAFPLLLPSLAEQRRIGERLESQLASTEALQEGFRKEGEALDRLPAAFLRRAFAREH